LDTRQNGQASRILLEKAVVPPVVGHKSVNMARQASPVRMIRHLAPASTLENGEKLAISRLAATKALLLRVENSVDAIHPVPA
jgi:hypothetical protein